MAKGRLASVVWRAWRCALLAVFIGPAAAHDIPHDVRIQAYVRPEAGRLRLLLRVPLAAMREVDVPTRGPGYLDLPRAEPALQHAARLWLADSIEAYENGERIAAPASIRTRVSLASDAAFASYDDALAHMHAPMLAPHIDLYWNQQLLDVLLDYPIRSERSAFALRFAFARLGLQVVTSLRFVPPEGTVRAFELRGDAGVVPLDPRWHQAALRFVRSGFVHILDGADHLLFLLCLVIPLRRWRPLVAIVTAFTLAHSITLAAAAFGHAPGGLWFPPLVETLIAFSILYMALENILGGDAGRRWIVAFAFGLVHGFGFSFALQDTLQFAGSHLVLSLFVFNVGVELGQLLVLVVLVPLLRFAYRHLPERMTAIVLSAFVAHTGWHWMLERGAQLAKFPLPPPDVATAAAAVRWLLAVAVVAAALWSVNGRVRQWMRMEKAPRAAHRGGTP